MAIRLFEQATHAQRYSKFRPTYPQTLRDTICGFVSRNGGAYGLVVDIACGPGQSTFYLSSAFDRCLGVDISREQIECARKKCQELNVKNVEFTVGDASDLPVRSNTADLVTCAQAWHWLDPGKLYREVGRVLKPKGCLAIYGYGNCRVKNKECHQLVSSFYSNTLKGYWHEGRKHIDNMYEAVKLPYQNTERHDLSMSHTMQLSEFIGYVSTWSGYRAYCKENPDDRALECLQEKMKAILEATFPGDDSEIGVEFPVFVIIGQKDH